MNWYYNISQDELALRDLAEKKSAEASGLGRVEGAAAPQLLEEYEYII